MENNAVLPYKIEKEINSNDFNELRLVIATEIIRRLLYRHIEFSKRNDENIHFINKSLIWPFKEHRSEILNKCPNKLLIEITLKEKYKNKFKFNDLKFMFTYRDFYYTLKIYNLMFYKNKLSFTAALTIDDIEIFNDFYYYKYIGYYREHFILNSRGEQRLHRKFNRYINESVRDGCDFE